ncbi:MAG TPA: multidrug efflux RND transporter permease subunit [Alphaproteobacteria bacterium]|nr:multidrug efflux RND transporter permease subunit [Alphaproteobacteria bacterium]
MGIGHLSIERPVFAMVLSIFILIVGAIAYATLPAAQYPDVAPPTVVVQTTYPGADAKTVAETVATPIEQEVNGVEDMLYMYSQSTSDGGMQLTVTFKLGTDLDKAQVLVENRVAVAEPRLPEEVRQVGVTTKKNSPDLLMVVHLLSPDNTYDQLYISNYALLQVRDTLLRLPGVGDVQMFGARDYSMRLWLDPDRAADLGLTAGDIVTAVRGQNVQVAGGQLAQPPVPTDRAFQPSLTLQGRLIEPDEFSKIIVKAGDDGRVVRVGDVGRVELGAQDYTTNSYLSGKTAVAMLISQQPGTNALATSKRVIKTMEELKTRFPKGLEYRIAYNPTEFIAKSIEELLRTIYEAVALVVIVVLIFLQRWRAVLIPILSIPVSLVGTFAVMSALDFSINNLTLFGLVLAVGIVVDDAIVVVENIERHLAAGDDPKTAARRTMDEVGGAVISIALVLSAVFIPTAFIPGISGEFYRQFALTIAVATVISAFNSLTLSPAVASLVLKAHAEGSEEAPKGQGIRARVERALDIFFAMFNAGFEWVAVRYGRAVARVVRIPRRMLAIYAVLILATLVMFLRVPTGFVPSLDQGYLIISIQLPSGASLARTDEIVKQVDAIARSTPGIDRGVDFAGFSGATRTIASNSGAIFAGFEPFETRIPKGLTANHIIADLRKRVLAVQGAFILVLPPPPIRGIGTAGGFSMRIEDRAGRGTAILASATRELAMAANRTPGLTSVYSPFYADVPELFVDVDRTKAQMLRVPVNNVFEALQVYLGSSYVNDFNLLSRTFRVTAQADGPFRLDRDTISRLRTRNQDNEMVQLGSVVNYRETIGTNRYPRYDLYPAAEINGDTLPGFSSGQAIAAMEQLADANLPDGLSYEWTDLSYQEKNAGNTAVLIFPLSVLFVFLVLSAQYESWTLPFAIILIVPMCLFSAMGGIALLGMDDNILTQIGFIVLVGLASKNAILIVEFARQQEMEGGERFKAVMEACRLRLRPILMTSFAFILGVVPLMVSSGAGAEMRQAIGTAVFFGMLGVTFFGLIFTPVFYVVVRGAVDAFQRRRQAGTVSQPT